MRGDARRWPIREECLLTTPIIMSLLKAWKMTVVWIDVTMPSFNAISRRYTINCSLMKMFSKFCKQGGKLEYSRYSQVSLLTINLMISLANTILLEKVIAKDH